MKKSTEYAKKMAAWWEGHQREVEPLDETDPVGVLIIAILSKGTTVAAAQEALSTFRSDMVDFNELRVTPEPEVIELLGPRYVDAQQKASDLAKALGYLFETEHTVSLEQLTSKNKKDRRQYLTDMPGMDAYTASVVLLHAFNEHAVPMDEDVLAAMQTEDVLPRDTDLIEVNGWLDRQIGQQESHAFWVVSKLWVTGELESVSTSKRGSSSKSAVPAKKSKAKPEADGDTEGEPKPSKKKRKSE